MKKICKLSAIVFIMTLLLLIGVTTAFAVPANPNAASFTQPDGTVIQVFLKGDEFLSWSEDQDGNLIVYDADKTAIAMRSGRRTAPRPRYPRARLSARRVAGAGLL